MRSFIWFAATFCGTFGSIAGARSTSTTACPPGLHFRVCVETRLAAVLDLTRPLTLGAISNDSAEPFAPPNRNHLKGAENVGIFRVVQPGGARTLVKMLHVAGSAGDGANYLRHEVRGMILAEAVGGPLVKRAGVISGQRRATHFVEMEEMFGGDPSSFTLKGLLRRGGRHARVSRAQLRGVAERLLDAMERGIVIDDPDLLFDGRDDVRWLDGAMWTVLEEDATTSSEAFTLYAEVLDILRKIDPAYGEMAWFDLRARMAQSPAWTPAQRARAEGLLRSEFATTYRWPAVLVDRPRETVAPASVPGIFERCEKLLRALVS